VGVNIILAMIALGKRRFRERRRLEENLIDLREMGCGDEK
jgi:hypothetical protein